MRWRSILCGFGVAAALMIIFFIFCWLWLIAPFTLNIDLSLLFIIIIVILPFLAGGIAGALAGKNGMLHGFWAAFLTWLLAMLVIVWFVPQCYTLMVALVSFIGFDFLGIAGGLSGVNIRKVRHELKYGKKEPKVKHKMDYKVRHRGLGKFKKL